MNAKRYTMTDLVKKRIAKSTKTERNNEIYKKYMEDGISMREIARQYGLSTARVSAIIIRADMEVLEGGE